MRTRAGGGASPPGPVGRGTWADDARAENGQKMSGLRGSYVSMENSRFLKCLAADYDLLREAAAAAGPGAAVPSCPGWIVTDLVGHVAEVYLHKTAAMRLNDWPSPWPPDLSGEEPLAVLGGAYAGLTAEFAGRQPGSPARTWHEPDQTVSFWIRRMAQETVIHRIDAQLAAGVPPAPVPEDLAVDGVDEVLRLFLAYGSQVWPEEFAQVEDHLATADGKDRITVIAGQAAWTVRPSPPQVIVDGGADDGAVAVIDAAPDAMLRWLWGRAADGEIVVTGDASWAGYLRRLLAAVT